MTSAPNSAIILVAKGPAISDPSSRTRSPSSGRSRRARSRAPLKASVLDIRMLPFLTHTRLPGLSAAWFGGQSERTSAQSEWVPGPHPGGQSVGRVVGLADDLFLLLGGDHAQDRAEDLLPCYPHFVADACEDGRLHEEAVFEFGCVRPLAPVHQLGPLLPADVDVALHLLELLLEGDRPHLGLRLKRVAQPDGPGLLREALDELVVAPLLDEEPGTGDAGLPGGREDSRDHPVRHGLHVGVLEDDVGRLATELQGDLGEVVGGILHDLLARLRRAGEGHLVHPRVAHQGAPRGWAEARDDVEDPGREARLLEEPGELQGGGRCLLGRLHHEGAAGGEGGSQLEGEQQERRVPRRDGPHHSNGLPPRVDEEVGLVRRDGLALDLVGGSGEVVVPLRQGLELTAHLPQELAVVGALYYGDVLRVLGEHVGEATHQPRPLGAGHLPPRPLVERRAGGAHRPVHVLIARLRHLRPHSARVGVYALEGLPRAGVHPLSTDEHLVLSGLPGLRGFYELTNHLLLLPDLASRTYLCRDCVELLFHPKRDLIGPSPLCHCRRFSHPLAPSFLWPSLPNRRPRDTTSASRRARWSLTTDADLDRRGPLHLARLE